MKLRQAPKKGKFQYFENEESCSLIKEHYGEENFCFDLISKNDIIKTVNKLPSNKASISNDIPFSNIGNFTCCNKLRDILNQ